MSAAMKMPYFVKPSINLNADQKQTAYQAAVLDMEANLAGETNPILKMATINCILKTHLLYYYWVGFYIVKNGRLEIGPYQGTLGCLHIDFSRGVCGRAAREEKAQVIADTYALEQGTAHIACDPNSKSEIAVPVFNKRKELIAVFDADSTLKYSFDKVDQLFLEKIMEQHFGT